MTPAGLTSPVARMKPAIGSHATPSSHHKRHLPPSFRPTTTARAPASPPPPPPHATSGGEAFTCGVPIWTQGAAQASGAWGGQRGKGCQPQHAELTRRDERYRQAAPAASQRGIPARLEKQHTCWFAQLFPTSFLF
jgi:hypothetical protein